MRPAPRKAKLKVVTKVDSEPEVPLKGRTTFERVFYGDELSDQSDSDSDHSDYANGRKRKGRLCRNKRKKKRKVSYVRRSPTPEAPELSDCEYYDLDEDDACTMSRQDEESMFKLQATPSTLTFHIPRGPTTVNLNIADLLATSSSSASSQRGRESIMRRSGTQSLLTASLSHSPSTESNIDMEDGISTSLKDKATNFLSMGPELRNRIYRLALVTESPIRFYPYTNTSREIALLQTCRQVYREARGILYGENSFHFERVDEKRGSYHSSVWKEIGYKDVIRFLQDIGPINRSLLRHISIDFTDACPHVTPTLEAPERKFVNDPVVLRVLNLISSSGAQLERFAVGFKGRQHVHAEDFHFLKAITSIRCRQLIHSFAYSNARVHTILLSKMKEVMEIPGRDDVDEKKKRPIARMLHEKPDTSVVRRFGW